MDAPDAAPDARTSRTPRCRSMRAPRSTLPPGPRRSSTRRSSAARPPTRPRRAADRGPQERRAVHRRAPRDRQSGNARRHLLHVDADAAAGHRLLGRPPRQRRPRPGRLLPDRRDLRRRQPADHGMLRAFRDDTLADTAFGRWFTDVVLRDARASSARTSTATSCCGSVAACCCCRSSRSRCSGTCLTLPGLLVLVGARACCAAADAQPLAARAASRPPARSPSCCSSPRRAHAQSPYWEDQTTGDDNRARRLADERPTLEVARRRPHRSVHAADRLAARRATAPRARTRRCSAATRSCRCSTSIAFLWRGFGQLGVGVAHRLHGQDARTRSSTAARSERPESACARPATRPRSA